MSAKCQNNTAAQDRLRVELISEVRTAHAHISDERNELHDFNLKKQSSASGPPICLLINFKVYFMNSLSYK